MKKYYVAFNYADNKGSGMGSTIFVAGIDNKNPLTVEGIANLQKLIEEKYGFTKCIILNILPLKD